MEISKIVKNVKRSIVKHSPEILTGMGIAGMIATTVISVKATPKALKMLEDEKEKREKELSKTDVVKTAWKCYIPAAITGTASILCIIGASSVNNKRNAALVTAYTLSETALKEYQGKVIETIGEKKEKMIQDDIAKDKLLKNPIGKNEVILTEKGDTLCYDTLSGRYFKSDIDKIKRIQNELNERMLSEMYISLNDFYYELGLSNTKQGDDLGWNIDNGLINIKFSACITENNEPCIVLDYDYAPRYDFGSLM